MKLMKYGQLDYVAALTVRDGKRFIEHGPSFFRIDTRDTNF